MYVPVGSIHQDHGISVVLPYDAFVIHGATYGIDDTTTTKVTYPNGETFSTEMDHECYIFAPKGSTVTFSSSGGSARYSYVEARKLSDVLGGG